MDILNTNGTDPLIETMNDPDMMDSQMPAGPTHNHNHIFGFNPHFKSMFGDDSDEDINASDVGEVNVVDDAGSQIDLPIPSHENLTTIKDHLKNISAEDRKKLLAHLAFINNVNPEKQRFSPASEKDILREKLRRKQELIHMKRQTKKTQQALNEKKTSAKQQYLQKINKRTRAYVSKDDDDEPVPDYVNVQPHTNQPVIRQTEIIDHYINSFDKPIQTTGVQPDGVQIDGKQ